MFDPKKYDTRMRDPEGKRKKPSGKEAERHLPKEAKFRKRPETRYDEKRAEEPLPPRENKPRPPAAPTSPPQTAPRTTPHPKPQRPKVFTPRSAFSPGPPAPASRRTRSGGGSSSPGQLSGCGFLMLLSTFGTIVGVFTRACSPDRTSRSTSRIERVEQPRTRISPDLLDPAPVMTRLQGSRSITEWTAHLPASRPDRISGAVLFGSQCTVPRAQISMSSEDGPPVLGVTDEHGVFVFDDVSGTHATVAVQGAIHLGAHPPPVQRLTSGTRAGPVTVDPRHAVLLLVDKETGWYSGNEAIVQVASTNGESRGTGAWFLPHEVALVTGLASAEFYDVLVQARGDELAGLVERVAPGEQAVVTMEPSKALFGRVKLPPGASTDDVEVVLTHGRLRVTPTVSEDGGWRAAHLPQDSWWEVHARRHRPNGEMASMDTQHGVHAGDGRWILLDLR